MQDQSDTANRLVHFIAFDKVAFNDNTAHLGTYLGNFIRNGSTGQFAQHIDRTGESVTTPTSGVMAAAFSADLSSQAVSIAPQNNNGINSFLLLFILVPENS